MLPVGQRRCHAGREPGGNSCSEALQAFLASCLAEGNMAANPPVVDVLCLIPDDKSYIDENWLC